MSSNICLFSSKKHSCKNTKSISEHAQTKFPIPIQYPTPQNKQLYLNQNHTHVLFHAFLTPKTNEFGFISCQFPKLSILNKVC